MLSPDHLLAAVQSCRDLHTLASSDPDIRAHLFLDPQWMVSLAWRINSYLLSDSPRFHFSIAELLDLRNFQTYM